MSSDSESENQPPDSQTRNKALWSVYSQLSKSEIFLNIYKRYPQPVTLKNALADLITETETNLDYEFPNALQKFTQRKNPSDPLDRIHLKQITFKAFIRRLGNIVLEEIYRAGSYEKTLKEFIFDVRGEDEEENSSFGSQSSSEFEESVHELSRVKEDMNRKMGNDLDLSEISPKNGGKVSRDSSMKESWDQSFEKSEKKAFGSEEGSEEFGKSRKKEERFLESEEREEVEKSEEREEDDKSWEKNKEKSGKVRGTEESDKSWEKMKEKSGKVLETEESESKKKKLEKSLKSKNDEEVSDTDKPTKISAKKPPLTKSVTKPETKLQKAPTLKQSTNTPSKSPLKPQNTAISSQLSIKKRRKSSSSSSQDYPLQNSNQAIKEVRQELNKPPNPESEPFASLFLTNLSIESSKQSWFSTQIKGKEIQFKKIFSFNNKEVQKPEDLPTVFESSLKKLSITPHPHHQDWFKSIQETFHPVKIVQKLGSKSKIQTPKLSFLDFVQIMNVWGEKYSKEQTTVIGDLVQSIDQYKELTDQYQDFSPIEQQMQILSLKLEKALKKHLETHKNQSILIEKNKKKFEDIFLFYSKVQRVQGTGDTFEDMETSNTCLTLAKFLKFCTDFDLVLGKGEEKRALSKESLTNVFKKTANNTRLMSQEQFITALDRITELMFTPELDKVLGSSLASKDMDEKRGMFYKQLEIESFNKYHPKKKAFGIAFSPEKYSRIPVNESSQQYRFKISEENLKKLEEWKKNKNARDSPQPSLKPIKEVTKLSHPVIKTSAKNLPGSGYAKRFKVKKPEDLQEKTENEEKTNIFSEKTEKEPQKITIQALNSLKYHDLDSEFAIKDLITEDSDEFFDKLYGIEPKLQGILKMHDEKLARGQKVVDKSKNRIN